MKMKEDKILKEKFGCERHFSVPDNYFDNFTDTLMKELPERSVIIPDRYEKKNGRHINVRYIAAVAACFIALTIVISTVEYKKNGSSMTNEMSQAKTSYPSASASHSSSVFDTMAEYTMLDNEDIYAYMYENQ